MPCVNLQRLLKPALLITSLTGCVTQPKLQMGEPPASPSDYTFIKNEALIYYDAVKVPLNDQFTYSPQQYLDDRLRAVLDPKKDAHAVLVWTYSITWHKPLPDAAPHLLYQYGAAGGALSAIVGELRKLQDQVTVDTFRCEFSGKYREQWIEVKIEQPLCPPDKPHCAAQPLTETRLQLDFPGLRENIEQYSRQCLDQIVTKVSEIKTAGLRAQPNQP